VVVWDDAQKFPEANLALTTLIVILEAVAYFAASELAEPEEVEAELRAVKPTLSHCENCCAAVDAVVDAAVVDAAAVVAVVDGNSWVVVAVEAALHSRDTYFDRHNSGKLEKSC
jgi:hypothetical protein